MTRIDDTFARLRARHRKAFVAYVMAGDPDFDTSKEIVLGLPAAGVDIIELGLPFIDPMADDPTIQLAGQRALAGGQTLDRTLAIARAAGLPPAPLGHHHRLAFPSLLSHPACENGRRCQ